MVQLAKQKPLAPVRIVPKKIAVEPAEPPPKREPIAAFVDLEIEARGAIDIQALRYVLVNSTRRLAEYSVAFLLEKKGARWSVSAASSVQSVDKHGLLPTELGSWLGMASVATALTAAEPRTLDLLQELGGQSVLASRFGHGLLVPITSRRFGLLAHIMLVKNQPWLPQHFALLLPLGEAYGHAWQGLLPRRENTFSGRGFMRRSRLFGVGAVAVLAACAFIPVPLSVVAPIELVADAPQIVASPMDAVVADILFSPGATVKAGQDILKLEDTKFRNDRDVALQKKAVAEAEYFKLLQAATASLEGSRDLSKAKATVDFADAELSYAEEMLDLATVKAVTDGVVVYADRQDWLGKPVATGEKILEIANPAKVLVRMDVATADVAAVSAGAKISAFWDDSPLRSEKGEVLRLAYRPVMTAGGGLAFKAYAKLHTADVSRLGKRGVARIDGKVVPLWLYVLRRPIVRLRQMLAV